MDSIKLLKSKTTVWDEPVTGKKRKTVTHTQVTHTHVASSPQPSTSQTTVSDQPSDVDDVIGMVSVAPLALAVIDTLCLHCCFQCYEHCYHEAYRLNHPALLE